MDFLILGAGGIGSFYGALLINSGHDVFFIAKDAHLKALQHNGLKLQHPKLTFCEQVKVDDLKNVNPNWLQKIDAVIITTKSTSTDPIIKELFLKLKEIKREALPFFISLQNGVENEDIISKYIPKNKVIGGLCRKIGAHIVKPGVIEATGNIETIIGAIEPDNKNKEFLNSFSEILEKANTICELTDDIRFELWKKLIINNGVNAICALLRIKTGELMAHDKLSRIVLGLMRETAKAAKLQDVNFKDEDILEMFELISKFDSIKPSMLIDVEHKKNIELDEICNIVIKNCEIQGEDAPYTRTISSLLEFIYLEKELNIR